MDLTSLEMKYPHLVLTSLGALEMLLHTCSSVNPRLHVYVSFYIRYHAGYRKNSQSYSFKNEKNIKDQGLGKKDLNAMKITIQITRPDSFYVYQSANLPTGQIVHRRVH